MFNYYEGWAKMEYWRLYDIVSVLTTYGALAEGHDIPEDYLISARSLRQKIESLIEKDARAGKFPEKVKWVPITEENYFTLPCDRDGDPIEPLDYYGSTVKKEAFIEWAISKKIPVPEEYKKLVVRPDEVEVEKSTKKIINFALHAGIYCASQGTEVKKEQLQAALDNYGPLFEEIWKEVPKNFKEPGGRPKKVIEKIIAASVFAGIEAAKEGKPFTATFLNSKLPKEIGNIDPVHVERIIEAIKLYISDAE